MRLCPRENSFLRYEKPFFDRHLADSHLLNERQADYPSHLIQINFTLISVCLLAGGGRDDLAENFVARCPLGRNE